MNIAETFYRNWAIHSTNEIIHAFHEHMKLMKKGVKGNMVSSSYPEVSWVVRKKGVGIVAETSSCDSEIHHVGLHLSRRDNKSRFLQTQ